MKLPPQFLLIPIIAALASCAAPPVNLEGREISRLDVVYEGRKTVDEDRLRQFIESKPGASYSPALIGEDIHRLFCTGFIDDVEIHAEPSGDDEVNLQFKVTTRPPMGVPLSFSGNHAFRDLTLIKASELKRLPESEADTLKAITRLEKFYHRRGYPRARVAVRRTRIKVSPATCASRSPKARSGEPHHATGWRTDGIHPERGSVVECGSLLPLWG